MPRTIKQKMVERKDFILGVNVEATPSPYEYIGKGVESLDISMGGEGEEKIDILGNNNFIQQPYKKSTSITDFLFDGESKYAAILHDLAYNEKINTDATFEYIFVFAYEETTTDTVTAYTQDGVITITSIGGATEGFKIDHDINFVGTKKSGTFNLKTKIFTPTAA